MQSIELHQANGMPINRLEGYYHYVFKFHGSFQSQMAYGCAERQELITD